MGSALGTREVVAAGEKREDGEEGEGVGWGWRVLLKVGEVGEVGGAVSPERLPSEGGGSLGLVIRASGNFLCRKVE